MRPLLIAAFALVAPASAQTLVNAFPHLVFNDVITDLQAPDDGSNRLFAAELDGRIRVFANDAAAAAAPVFLDLTSVTSQGSYAGLFGFTFDPAYAQNGYVYVHYARDSPGGSAPRQNVIARYEASADDPDVADPNSAVILLTSPQTGNHNGGQIQFGLPEGPGGERYLYVALGDAGGQGDPHENGQDPTTLPGSLLRLDVNGGGLPLDCAAGTGTATVPPDNPFLGPAEEACDELYAYGFRNPWRFSFGPDGRLWLADVGQSEREEIDLIAAGGNYGWNAYEGSLCYDAPCDPAGKAFPVHEYPHVLTPEGGFSITGGYVYTGNNCADQLGRYVYGDYVSGNVWSLTYDGATVDDTLLGSLPLQSVVTFGRDEQGEVYFTDDTSGTVLTLGCEQPVTVTAVPVGGPVVVGPGGGAFSFDLTLTNTTAGPRTFAVWAAADLATGDELAAVLGPVSVTLAGGASTTRRVRLRVPAAAPSGTSTLVVKAGAFPGGAVSGARFTVTKQPPETARIGATAAIEAVYASAAWLATGWPFSGETGAPPGAPAPPADPVALSAAPNPTGAHATIAFALATRAEVTLAVYDALGRCVAVLVEGTREAGRHEAVFDGAALPSGAYLYRLQVGERVRTGRLVLAR